MPALYPVDVHVAPEAGATHPPCFHCGTLCPDRHVSEGDRFFCCRGCRTVYELLSQSGLDRFYELETTPGVRLASRPERAQFAYLDDPLIRRQVLDFADGRTARATFRVPAMHCAACVWLIENLHRLRDGIGSSTVDFPRREVRVAFDEQALALSEVVTLLASLGYEPVLTLRELETPAQDRSHRSLLVKLGLAGFAFGNVMMLSFPSYLGLNPMVEGDLRRFFGILSLLLALPVLLYSASDYWRAAWRGLRQRVLTIEFPIALGIAALFGQSAFDILARSGEGYLDSFTGLIFLLLCGRWFQRKTFETLAFDRDYRSYFPLSALRREGDGWTAKPVTSLQVGDHLLVRHHELIPADAVLIGGEAVVDYSFVSGEAAPTAARSGDYLYAGGRQMGGAIELQIVKEVSQSYLTTLWNQAAFHRERDRDLNDLTNRAGRVFTLAVVILAVGTALYWAAVRPEISLRAFSAVLIVACPCALALSAPFTLGSAQRLLGCNRFYLRSPAVVEALSRVQAVVFDKTGTLTIPRDRQLTFSGIPLSSAEQRAVAALARHSTHPLSRQIAGLARGADLPAVTGFAEWLGLGIEGWVEGHWLRLGSASWLGRPEFNGTSACISIDGDMRGAFITTGAYRQELQTVIDQLSARYELSVLSGDNDHEAPALRRFFGGRTSFRFRQDPHEKLAFIAGLQKEGRRVLMVGDGLNDAGALRQSDVGIALTDDIATFSPACDAILDARAFGRFADLLAYARSSLRILKTSFAISLVYNAAGIGFAASGALSPLVSAILMPLSSFSVIAFSLSATRLAARRHGLRTVEA